MASRDPVGRAVKTVLILAVWSIAVGLLMSWFDISPAEMIAELPENLAAGWDVAVDAVRWAVPYALAGAVIVIPIWLAMNAGKLVALRKRGKSGDD